MIHLFEVTQLVYHNVVLQVWRQKEDPVVEIEITQARATPPTPTLIANRYSVIGKLVVGIVVRQSLVNERSRRFLVRLVVFRNRRWSLPSGSPASPIHRYAVYQNPAVSCWVLVLWSWY